MTRSRKRAISVFLSFIVVTSVITVGIALSEPATASQSRPIVDATSTTSQSTVEAPSEEWNNTYGGDEDDRGKAVAQLNGGGFAIAGVTNSFHPPLPDDADQDPGAGTDMHLIKTDATGSETLNTHYGLAHAYEGYANAEGATSLAINASGAIVLAGWARTPFYTSPKRIAVYNNGFSTSSMDEAYGKEQANDVITRNGEIVLVGTSGRLNSGKDERAFLIEKTSTGNSSRTFGKFSHAQTVIATDDGGLLIGGEAPFDDNTIGAQPWLVKLGPNGAIEWNRTYPSQGDAFARGPIKSVVETENGYVATFADDGDLALLKVNATGHKQWVNVIPDPPSVTLTDGASDQPRALVQTTDGGFAIAGITERFGKDWEGYIVKTDSEGRETWNKTFGGNNRDEFRDLEQTNDGGFILGGTSFSFGGSDADPWLVKLAPVQSSNGSDTGTTAPLSLQASDTKTTPNTTVTVEFNLTNQNGTNLAGPALKVTEYPSSWTITSHEDVGSTYSESNGVPTWLWLQISAGSSKKPTITFRVPNGTATGNYTVTGQAVGPDGTTVNQSATITVSEETTKTITEEIAGKDGTIGIVEIQRAIRLWANNQQVPNTGGKTIGIVRIQELIQQWASGG